MLDEKIAQKTARVGVIGLGYVGLPLAVEFARDGFRVIGIDVDAAKVERLNRGESYIADVRADDVKQLLAQKKFTPTCDYEAVRELDVIFICVPTPFNRMKAPDLQAVTAATQSIAPRLRPGQLIILQSTTYPGTTEEVCQPILEQGGLRAGKDFHLAFSPERIDPGATSSAGWNVRNTPKVVGGLTPRCSELAKALLVHLTKEVYVVSSPRTAEMTKLLENIFRSVNIALVNELALLSERMDIDFWQVIDAAKTKPFGFMPFYPGAGVGGHCIPVDPYYLSWKAREYDFTTKFIELAAEINQGMPFHVVKLLSDSLNRLGQSVQGARVLVLGVAFKPNVEDARNSPAERIIELLVSRGAQVQYHDPHVPVFDIGDDVFHRARSQFKSVPLTEDVLRDTDAVVIVTAHRSLDYARVVKYAPLVIDSANATVAAGPTDNVVRLGAPFHRQMIRDSIMEKRSASSIDLPTRPAILVVVSGPSGVGKDAALKRMRELNYPFYFLVTNTTRPKRPEEVDGVDYHFVTKEQFAAMEARNEFLERAVVYGYDYGNSRGEVREALARGSDVIMRIDVQGAATLKKLVPDAVFIFLLPPSMESLERRLRRRRSEPEEYLQIRLHAARLEINEVEKFDYAIVNEDDALDETARLIHAIIEAEKCRVKARRIII